MLLLTSTGIDDEEMVLLIDCEELLDASGVVGGGCVVVVHATRKSNEKRGQETVRIDIHLSCGS